MAGRPKLLALKQRIANDDLEDEIFEAIADGNPIWKVCEEFDITSRKMLYDWVKSSNLQEKFAAARKFSAGAHAEKAGDALDELNDQTFITGPEVSLAIGKAKYRQWLASKYDKEQYGDTNAAHIQISFGDLHMQALQSPGARPNTLIPAEVIQEAEILRIEEAENTSKDGEANAPKGKNQIGPSTPLIVPVSDLAPELGELL